MLCIYALASTPYIVYFGLSALFHLTTAMKGRAADAAWWDPRTWATPSGYTREGFEDLVESAGDFGKAVLGLLPWGLLLYLAGH